MSNLTFDALRQANLMRLPEFKNRKGELAHSKPDGSDWPLDAWTNALSGEAGEAANIAKKVRRGDLSLEEARPMLAKELADVLIYADLTALQLGIGLDELLMEKFNETSRTIGSSVRLTVVPAGLEDELAGD